MLKQYHTALLAPHLVLAGILSLSILFMVSYSQRVFGHEKLSRRQFHSTNHHRASQPPARGTAYYIDFDADTYTAVTPNNIKQSANKIIPLDADALSIFYKIVSQRGGEGKFDGRFVRLLVQDGTKPPLLIDQEGVVLSNGSQYRLTPRALVGVDHFLTSLPARK